MTFKVTWYGEVIKNVAKKAVADALLEGAERVMAVSNDRVPHDTGALQGSSDYSVDANKLEAVVSYGNATDEYPGVGNYPYAARLHEHPEYHFRKGRQGKYLESAVNDESDRVQEFMAEKLRQAHK